MSTSSEVAALAAPIMTFDDTARKRFRAAYCRHKYPVVVKGGIDDWAAKDWTYDYLCERAGDRVVRVRYSDGAKFASPTAKATVTSMPFAEASELINSPAGAGHYILQQSLTKTFPGLLDDIGELHLLSPGQFVLQSNFWLGATGCKTHLHYDLSDNFLIQIRGVKKVTLYPDFMAHGLYPATDSPMPYCSRLDVFTDVDTQRYPLYGEVRGARREVLLKPGDMLYIPRRWWHAVETVETSISLNFWWNSIDSPSEVRDLVATLGMQGWWGGRYKLLELAVKAGIKAPPIS